MTRFTKNEFSFESKATIGVEFDAKMLTVENSVIKCQIWDTAGQERYRSISQAYYKNAYGGLLVYDITKRETFENAGRWLKELKEHAEKEISIILVGNKTDLKHLRQVQEEEGVSFAKDNGLFFTETSALDNGDNKIESAFQTVVEGSQASSFYIRLTGQLCDLQIFRGLQEKGSHNGKPVKQGRIRG